MWLGLILLDFYQIEIKEKPPIGGFFTFALWRERVPNYT